MEMSRLLGSEWSVESECDLCRHLVWGYFVGLVTWSKNVRTMIFMVLTVGLVTCIELYKIDLSRYEINWPCTTDPVFWLIWNKADRTIPTIMWYLVTPLSGQYSVGRYRWEVHIITLLSALIVFCSHRRQFTQFVTTRQLNIDCKQHRSLILEPPLVQIKIWTYSYDVSSFLDQRARICSINIIYFWYQETNRRTDIKYRHD